MRFGLKREYLSILLLALVVRIIAAVFSQGYGMHDDHFLVIEASASWTEGYDYNHWLPWSQNTQGHPEGHSFTYVGLNYCYFAVMKGIGISDPKILMFVNRLIHALLSMLVVIYGIKITEKLAGISSAKKVGWLLALLWILPFLSVRNLVEVAPIPALMAGVWLCIRERSARDFLWAGLLIGLAVSFRYQIGVFAIGMAAYYFFAQKWKPFLLFCAGVLTTFVITQGLVDYLIWGYPFAEMIAYVEYNLEEGTGYLPNQNYFMYFFVLAGSLLFPLGLVLLTGFFRSWKKYAVLFIPVFLFLIFHTLYPNRQERFILTVLPLFIVLGVTGYALFRESAVRNKIWNISWIAFWVLNIPLLLFASTMYSKKSRVEAMYALYGNSAKNELVLLEGSGSGKVSMLPQFYSGDWTMAMNSYEDTLYPDPKTEYERYDYVVFFDEEKLPQRIKAYKNVWPEMRLVKKCDPSMLDALLRKLNPRNSNEYIEVWATNRKEAHEFH